MKNKTRFRKIRKWGNSFVVLLTSTDVKDLGIKEGDEMDISDCLIRSKEISELK